MLAITGQTYHDLIADSAIISVDTGTVTSCAAQYIQLKRGIGFRCERPDEVRGALEAMMLADGPALCEAVVDPFEPPWPPKVQVKQALHVAEALARGEPNPGRIALTLFRDKIHDLMAHDDRCEKTRG